MTVCATCRGRVAAVGILGILGVTLEALSAKRVPRCIRTHGTISVVQAPISTVRCLIAAAALSSARYTVGGISVRVATIFGRAIRTALTTGAIELTPLNANGLVAAVKICQDAVLTGIVGSAKFPTWVSNTVCICSTFGAATTVIAVHTKWGCSIACRLFTTATLEASTLIGSHTTGIVCIARLAVF